MVVVAMRQSDQGDLVCHRGELEPSCAVRTQSGLSLGDGGHVLQGTSEAGVCVGVVGPPSVM